MDKTTYKTKYGVTQYKPICTEDDLGQNLGFCLACGNKADCVEPDARKYTCASCGKDKVYGLEELMMMNLLILDND